MSGARVSSGSESCQTYSTPDNFMQAVRLRFGTPAFDLAASVENTKATAYYSEDNDALTKDWTKHADLLWLNPPFKDIAPWARKCAVSKGATILLLVPAAVGSNWFRDHVAGIADVSLLNGRLCFDGNGLYPKDCILARYAPDAKGSVDIWTWKKTSAPCRRWDL